MGKILRINPDGTIPSDNPFFSTPGPMKEIWALGLRNPFTFAFSPTNSSLMYINDVGENTWEEVDPGIRGANYGWPVCEGFCSNPNFVNPVYAYNHNGSSSAITGGAFYQSNQFPSDFLGNYFFGDYARGFIRRMLPNHQVSDFLTGINSPVDIAVGPDGSLYYLSIGGGSVHKVQFISGGNSPTLSLSNTAGPMGTTVKATGTNFAAGSAITIKYDGLNRITSSPPSITTDKLGSFTATFNVPRSTAGPHTIAAKDRIGHAASAAFSVTPMIKLSPSSGPPGSLVKVVGTGFAASSLVTIYYDGAAKKMITSGPLGGFSPLIRIPTSTHGAHTILARDVAGNSASATFLQ